MKSSWFKKIANPFRETQLEVSWFGPVVSAVLVAMLVELILEALFTWGGLKMGSIGVGGLAIITIVFVVFYHRSREARKNAIGAIADLPNPRRYLGIIFLFSNERTLRKAVEYHQPEFCWLIVTPKMQQPANQAIANLNAEYPDLRFDTVPIPNLYDTEACYRAVRNIYQYETARLELDPQEIISDITGGTKPMTMGMILACLERDHAIEHIPTEYKITGEPVGPLPPIQISVRRGDKEPEVA